METKSKNIKRIEQGKKLSEINKKRREEWKRMEEELEKHNEVEEEEKEESLTISSSQEKEEETSSSSKMNVFLPVLALTVVGVGTFWYYRESKKDSKESKKPEVQKENIRPRIMSRLERLE